MIRSSQHSSNLQASSWRKALRGLVALLGVMVVFLKFVNTRAHSLINLFSTKLFFKNLASSLSKTKSVFATINLSFFKLKTYRLVLPVLALLFATNNGWGQVYSSFKIIINTVFAILAAMLSNLRSVILSCMTSKPAARKLQPVYLDTVSKSDFIVFNAFIFKLKAYSLLLLLLWSANSNAQTTVGPNSPGTGANVTGQGTDAWSTPTNIYTANNSYATVSLAKNVISNYLRASNFGFSIPANATILGITVNIERKSSGAGMRDNVVSLVNGAGAVVGNNNAFSPTNNTGNWPTTEAAAAYGGAADNWNASLTAADINSSNFGVVLATKNSNNTTRTASVDYFTISVTYSVPPPCSGTPCQCASYCATNFTDVTYEFITNVTFEGINNNSVGITGGPVDYTGLAGASVTAGSTYPISVTIDPDASDYVYVWFDWNQDGDFTDAGEAYTVAANVGTAGPHTINIPVPASAVPGSTRMRVMVDYNNAVPDPCRSATYGEVEDYCVTVTAPTPPIITSFTPNTVCASSNATVTITGTNFTGATAVSFGGTAAQSFTVNSATQITAVVGCGNNGNN